MALKHMEVMDPAATGLTVEQRRSVGTNPSRSYSTSASTLPARPLELDSPGGLGDARRLARHPQPRKPRAGYSSGRGSRTTAAALRGRARTIVP